MVIINEFMSQALLLERLELYQATEDGEAESRQALRLKEEEAAKQEAVEVAVKAAEAEARAKQEADEQLRMEKALEFEEQSHALEREREAEFLRLQREEEARHAKEEAEKRRRKDHQAAQSRLVEEAQRQLEEAKMIQESEEKRMAKDIRLQRENDAEARAYDDEREEAWEEDMSRRKQAKADAKVEAHREQERRERELGKVFIEFDIDAGGWIDSAELFELGVSRRLAGQKRGSVWTGEKNAKMMAKMDADHNGKVDCEEFVRYSPLLSLHLASISLHSPPFTSPAGTWDTSSG